MIYLFIIICVCVQIFTHDVLSLGITTNSLTNCFCYQFAHASWLHLAINAFCLAYMFKPIHNLYNKRLGYTKGIWILIASYLSSVVAALIAAKELPIVGASGMVFFLLGMLLALDPTIKQLKSMVWVAASLVVGAIIGNSAVLLHILCFVYGALFVLMRVFYDNRRLLTNK